MSLALQLLESSSPVIRFARSKPLGCCTFTGAWSLALAGLTPTNPLSVTAWAACEPTEDWWERSQIDLDCYQSRRWSPLLASHDLHGGELHIGMPGLTPGRVHLVQDWRPDLGTGHSYLVVPAVDGWVLADSSTTRGLRIRPLDQWPRIPSRLRGVLALPEGV